MSSSARKRGRPPAGRDGEKVSDYPQLTVRLSPEARARLNTLSLLLAQPASRIIDQALEVYVQHLPEEDQKILGPLVARLARGDWPVTSHWANMWERPGKKSETRATPRDKARRQGER
jgi:predicted DNA-binding protein